MPLRRRAQPALRDCGAPHQAIRSNCQRTAFHRPPFVPGENSRGVARKSARNDVHMYGILPPLHYSADTRSFVRLRGRLRCLKPDGTRVSHPTGGERRIVERILLQGGKVAGRLPQRKSLPDKRLRRETPAWKSRREKRRFQKPRPTKEGPTGNDWGRGFCAEPRRARRFADGLGACRESFGPPPTSGLYDSDLPAKPQRTARKRLAEHDPRLENATEL
jgi:hypothetical protein